MKTLTNDEIEIILSNMDDRIKELENQVERLQTITLHNTIKGF